jgi:hypothetical protein
LKERSKRIPELSVMGGGDAKARAQELQSFFATFCSQKVVLSYRLTSNL